MYLRMSQLKNRLGSYEGLGEIRSVAAPKAPPAPTSPSTTSTPTSPTTTNQTATDSTLPGVLTGVASIVGSIGTIGAQFYAAHAQTQLEKARLKRETQAAQLQPQIVYAPAPSSVSPGLIIGMVVMGLVMMGGMIFVVSKSSGSKKKN